MSVNEPLQCIEKIVLEIIDRSHLWFHQWRARYKQKFNIRIFNAREAAYAFLRQYNGEAFVKGQKIIVRYNNEELHLCVRDLTYGNLDENSNRISNSSVEFIYRKGLFREIKWPLITVNRTNRVRWASDNNDQLSEPSSMTTIQSIPSGMSTPVSVPDINIIDDYSSLSVDETANTGSRIVPCGLCNNLNDDQSLSVNSISENVTTSLCQEYRTRRLVPSLENLQNDENHFRSSVFIHVNHLNNP